MAIFIQRCELVRTRSTRLMLLIVLLLLLLVCHLDALAAPAPANYTPKVPRTTKERYAIFPTEASLKDPKLWSRVLNFDQKGELLPSQTNNPNGDVFSVYKVGEVTRDEVDRGPGIKPSITFDVKIFWTATNAQRERARGVYLVEVSDLIPDRTNPGGNYRFFYAITPEPQPDLPLPVVSSLGCALAYLMMGGHNWRGRRTPQRFLCTRC